MVQVPILIVGVVFAMLVKPFKEGQSSKSGE